MVTVAHSLLHLRHFTVQSLCLLLEQHGFLIEYSDDSISVVARKTNQVADFSSTFLSTQYPSYKRQIRRKILREVLGDEDHVVSQNNEQKFFLSNKGHRYEMHFSDGRKSNSGLFSKLIKERTFGVARDDCPLTPLSCLKTPKLVFQKLLSKILRFDKQEISGSIKLATLGDKKPLSPLVEYKYEETGGIVMLK